MSQMRRAHFRPKRFGGVLNVCWYDNTVYSDIQQCSENSKVLCATLCHIMWCNVVKQNTLSIIDTFNARISNAQSNTNFWWTLIFGRACGCHILLVALVDISIQRVHPDRQSIGRIYPLAWKKLHIIETVATVWWGQTDFDASCCVPNVRPENAHFSN